MGIKQLLKNSFATQPQNFSGGKLLIVFHKRTHTFSPRFTFSFVSVNSALFLSFYFFEAGIFQLQAEKQ